MTDGERIDDDTVARLHATAGAGRWHVPLARWHDALAASLDSLGPVPTSHREARARLETLHLSDLALACACADGDEDAWTHFVREYRPALYRAATAVSGSGDARELADSLYAELFGLSEQDGTRRSLFRYFQGRSSLATWLRAVLAQRHVDRVRRGARLTPLPEPEDAVAPPAPARSEAPERARFLSLMGQAVALAVAALDPRARLRLTCYIAQNLTLAQIGRLMGEHEATVSRHLSRARAAIRTDVERRLRDDAGMGPHEMAECFASVAEDAGPLDLSEMLGGTPGRKNAGPDRST
jgi:RNA polymerase sigma-70 factor (ECF subfamily)